MIPFEQAAKLKKGDPVFEGKYTCFVVKTKVDKKAGKVFITYTDGAPGGDEFEGTNEKLALEKEGAAPAKAQDAPAPKSSKPAPKTARKASGKKHPELPPLPKATDELMDRLKVGVERNSQWRSLDWFEEDRAKIAKSLSDKLGIPLTEFDDTPDTACFHFMSLALAIANWLHKSGWEEIRGRDEKLMNQFEYLARSKIMAGILVRLFSHAYVQNIGEMEGLDSMVKAFCMASGANETMFGHILTAHTYVRQSALLMAQYLAEGSPDGEVPVKCGFFEPYDEFLENDEDGFMPPDAVMDASLQIFATLQFLNSQASLPVALDTLPDDAAKAHHFLRNYVMFSGMYRTPATLQLGSLSFKGASLAAALDSLSDEKPLVLMDAIFQDGDAVNIIIPFNPTSDAFDAKSLPMHLAKECEKLPAMPALTVTSYQMF